MTLSDQYRDLHRQRKARALADTLERLRDRGGLSGSLAVAVTTFTPEQRFGFETLADVVPLSGKPASLETWRRVAKLLHDRELAASTTARRSA